MVNKELEIKVTKECIIKSATNVEFIYEVEFDVVPLDVRGDVFGSLYIFICVMQYSCKELTRYASLRKKNSSSSMCTRVS